MKRLRMMDTFSGIAGFSLAARWTGQIDTIQFIEIEPFCQRVIAKHFEGVPIHGDIRTFDGKPFRGRVDILTGGFPCQPFSVAGQQRGKDDSRHLWPEMLRVIQEVRPAWVIGENVGGILNSMVFEDVLSDLEGAGYEVQPLVIPACAVNAPHRRDRVWIVAYTESKRLARREVPAGDESPALPRRQTNLFDTVHSGCVACKPASYTSRKRTDGKREPTVCNLQTQVGRSEIASSNSLPTGKRRQSRKEEDESGALISVTHSNHTGRREQRRTVSGAEELRSSQCGVWAEQWPEVATALCRMDDGIPRRVDRLRGLGNAIVPQVAYLFLQAIVDMENAA